MSPSIRNRDIIMALLGISGLLLKGWMSDSISELTYCYLGNISVSFAVYFLISLGAKGGWNKLIYVIIALLVVESFELADGFGIMANVYDPFDYLANALGIFLACLIDVLLSRIRFRIPWRT